MLDGRITRRSLIAVPLLGLTGLGIFRGGSSTATISGTSSVSFVSPKDGDQVTNPVTVIFGVTGVTLAPAGPPNAPGTGHHHLIIDRPAIAQGMSIPHDSLHLHVADGSDRITVPFSLPEGPHTLIAQVADGAHVAYGGVLNATIQVTVAP
jgi:hypothetical protein